MNVKSGRAKTAPGLSVPIVRYHGGQYSLEKQNIEKVFCRDDIANAKVVIISMCGAMQCGKSLTLNHFYDYFNRYKATSSPRYTLPPRKCFDWTNGIKTQRNTLGIHITKKPVLMRRDGEDIAVFFMDSEGINVHKCDSVQQFIYALITLFSSVQIVNVEKDIKDQDLYPLKSFMSAYDRLKDYSKQKAVFESNLLFLVRDFANTLKYKLGDDDEEAYLSKTFSTGYKRTIYSKMQKAFSNMRCFIMPHPGAAATVRQLKHQFKGSLKEYNETFENCLMDLMERVLQRENLVPKIVNGKPMTCKQFPEYIDACFSALDGHGLTDGLLKLVTHTRFEPLVDDCKTIFKNSLKAYSNRIAVDEDEFSDVCDKQTEEVLEIFNRNETSSCLSDENEKYRHKLQTELQEIMEEERDRAEQFHNSSKKRINREISKCEKTYEMELQSAMDRGINDRGTFEHYHEVAVNGALALFDRSTKPGGERFIEKARSSLKDIMHEIFGSKLQEVIFEEDAVRGNGMEKQIVIGVRGGKLEHEACILEFQPGTFTSETEISLYLRKQNEAACPEIYVWKSPVLHFEPSEKQLRKKVKCKIPCWYVTFSDEADARKNVFVLQKFQNEWVKIHQEVMDHKTYITCKLSNLSPIRLAWSSEDKPQQVATILYQNTCGNFIAKFFITGERSIMTDIKETAKAERYLIMSDLNTIEVKLQDEIEVSLSVAGSCNPAVRKFVAKDISSTKVVRSEQFTSPAVQDNECLVEMRYEVRVNGRNVIFNPFRVDLRNPGRPDTAQPGPFSFARTDARGDYMTVATGPVEANY